MTVEDDYQRGDELVREARAHVGFLLLQALGAGFAGYLVWAHVVEDVRLYGLDWTVQHKPLWLWAVWVFVGYWGCRWATWAARNLSGAAYKYPLGRRLKGRTLWASIVAGLASSCRRDGNSKHHLEYLHEPTSRPSQRHLRKDALFHRGVLTRTLAGLRFKAPVMRS